MSINGRKVWIGYSAAAVVLIGVALYFWQFKKPSYDLVPIRKAAMKEAIYGIGTVQARHRFSFKVGIIKTIEAVYVKEGDSVQKGQNLLKLSDGMVLKSPFAGSVTQLPYFAGENTGPEVPLITVEDLKDRYVTASLEQQGALRVKPGMAVNLSFESIRSKIFTGKLISIIPKNSQFVSQIEVENLPPEIIPAMTSDVAIIVAEKENVLQVPVKSISSGMVTVLRDGKKKKIKLELGAMDNEWAEVTSGELLDQDQIIVPR